jgi:RNA polymerase sigma-70 factor (ECF subfamily)
VQGALVDSAKVGATPLREALEQERRRQVRSALAEIPARERVVVELSFLDGLSHAEIARQLGEPLGTVKTRIRSGFLRLRESLAALVEGDKP